MTLVYLTTNKFKVREAEMVLGKQYGIELEIINPDFEIYEIQAKTCGEVAGFSARYAADKIGKPCLKSDTGLYLEMLGGLPGPYNAYFDKQIGTEKFLDMMKDKEFLNLKSEQNLDFSKKALENIILLATQDQNTAKKPVKYLDDIINLTKQYIDKTIDFEEYKRLLEI